MDDGVLRNFDGLNDLLPREKAMKEKLEKLFLYALDRLNESSTIQGLAAVATLAGGMAYDDSKIAAWAFIAAGVSSVIKIFLPDGWNK